METPMSTYIVMAFGHEMEIKAKSPFAAAEAYVEQEPNDGDRTILWRVQVAVAPRKVKGLRPRPRAYDWFFVIPASPVEPACSDSDSHEWDEGEVYSRGRGVIYTDTCAYCGLRKTINTWDQDPETGSEGHRTMRYSYAVSE
jgi:hypothetical protein